jgi:hypothetical protein
MHGMGEVKKSTYQVTNTDAATKTLTMTVTEAGPDAEGQDGTATIDGDRLTLSKADDKIVLNRITAADFEKRKAAPPAIPGIPGGPVIPE